MMSLLKLAGVVIVLGIVIHVVVMVVKFALFLG